MMWHIVSDSSCDLFTLPECPDNVDFATVPFSVRIGDKEFIDDENIDVEEMLSANEKHGVSAQSSCPNAHDWAQLFSAEGPVFAFTISGALSGSYNTACMAKKMIQEKNPDKHITVINSKGTGPSLVLLIRMTCRLIAEGLAPAEIEKKLLEAVNKNHILFSLASYRNLIRAGRMSRFTGLIAGSLHMWGIGIGDEEGKIAMRNKARGQKNMLNIMIEEIKSLGLNGKEIIISHCQNEECALRLKEKLLEIYEGIKVDVLKTRGLCSFYAERRGLILAF